MDTNSIALYKQALEEGEEFVHNIRIMIIGHSGVGKTTLARRLLGDPVGLTDSDSTNGIEVHIDRCKVAIADQRWEAVKQDKKTILMHKRQATVLARWQQLQERKVNSMPGVKLGDKSLDALNIEFDEDVTARTQPEPTEHEESDTDINARASAANDNRDTDLKVKTLMAEVASKINVTDTDADFADVSVWDFAGQYVFYSTHQMFLSPRAVYLLVTDISKHIGDVVTGDECYFDSAGPKQCPISDFVDFWLNSIHSYTPSVHKGVPPVILVGTHADELTKVGGPDYRQKQSDAYFEAVRRHLIDNPMSSHLADEDFDIDNKGIDPKLETLKKKIFEVASSQPSWDEPVPTKWLPLERALSKLKETGLKVIDHATVEELNEGLAVPISRADELELFLRFQHESGNLLYFSDSGLRDKVVLDSQWLVDALKSLITAKMFCVKQPEIFKKWDEFFQKGILRKELLDAVWKKETNCSFHDNREHLLAIMEKLNLIAKPRSSAQTDVACELEDNQRIGLARISLEGDEEQAAKKRTLMKQEEEYYLAPCMLKDPPPEGLLHPCSQPGTNSTSVLCFSFNRKFLPAAVFHHLIATCLSKWPLWRQGKTDQIFCGCGVFKVDSTHQMTACLKQYVIEIWVTKFGDKDRLPCPETCMEVREFIDACLRHTADCLPQSPNFEVCIKCPEATYDCLDSNIPVDDLRNEEEMACSRHRDFTHVCSSKQLMNYWYPIPVRGHGESEHSDRAQSELFIKRLSTGIVDGSIHVLKPFLQDYIETGGYQSVDNFLHRFKKTIDFIVLCSRVEMIFPPDQSSTDMAKWDVSLYFTILLNICNLSGQELRCLHELRLQRNNIYDKRDSSSLGQNVFNEYWSKIEKSLEALSKKDTQTTDGLQSKLDEIKSGMFVSDSAVEALIDWYNTEKVSENNTAALKQALQDHEKLVSVIEEFDTEQQFQRYRKRKRATVTISGHNAEDVRHAHEHMLPLKMRKSLRDPNLIALHDAICKDGEAEVVDIQDGSVTMILECASANSVIHVWNTYQSGIMATQFEGILRDLRLKSGTEMALQITCNAEEFLGVLKLDGAKVAADKQVESNQQSTSPNIEDGANVAADKQVESNQQSTSPNIEGEEEMEVEETEVVDIHQLVDQQRIDDGANVAADKQVESNQLSTSPNIEVVADLTLFKDKLLSDGRGTPVYEGVFEGSIPVAVKKIHRTGPQYTAELNEHVRILREVEALRKISHPNIVRFLKSESTSDFQYIAFELCHGTLDDYVDTQANWSKELHWKHVLIQMAEGLQFLHYIVNMAHRDLKPTNVLLFQSQSVTKVVLADFGQSKFMANMQCSMSGATGSLGWIAPEASTTRGSYYTESDIFSLGCLFYYVATEGAHPFGQNPIQRQTNISQNKSDLSALKPCLGCLRELITDMIQFKHNDRPDARRVSEHPSLMSDDVIMDFLHKASNKINGYPQSQQNILEDPAIIPGGNWLKLLPVNTQLYLTAFTLPRHKQPMFQGKEGSVRHLLRAIRNCSEHFPDLDAAVRTEMGASTSDHVEFWLGHYPWLLTHVHSRMKGDKSLMDSIRKA